MKMRRPLRLAVFISGRGSNLQALIDATQQPDFPAQIACVLSNVPGAYGLTRAQMAGIDTMTVDHKAYAGRVEFEDALHAALVSYDIDIICLAGFLRILTPHFINRWPGRIINIHPSLLPDYKGLDTHARAIADGKPEAGCTVHYVVPDVDSGEIIVQRRVPIMPDDTPDTLAARVLEQEHIAYPQAIVRVAASYRKALESAP